MYSYIFPTYKFRGTKRRFVSHPKGRRQEHRLNVPERVSQEEYLDERGSSRRMGKWHNEELHNLNCSPILLG
jgi:hypothetical protein